MKVFEETIVKGNPVFFLAGRGGETNLHKGNYDVRQRVLDNARAYAVLSPRERGQKFSKKVLNNDLRGYTFVVRLSYFWRNYENGKIASAKLESVVHEHGSLAALRGLPESAYVTIGETWCLNIVGAILRQAVGRLNPADPMPLKPKEPRVRGTKRKARTNKQEDKGAANAQKMLDTPANVPVPDSQADSPKSSFFPEQENSLLRLTKLPRVSFGSLKPPSIPSSGVLRSQGARRVSLYPSVDHSSRPVPLEPVSFDDSASFFPIHEETKTDRAGRLPRQVSNGSVHSPAPDGVASFASPQEAIDPLECILDDWDTEKWPQLDLHDLLAV